MLQEEPLVYRITKVKNTTPKGVINFTVKQDKYEPEHDYVQLDPNKEDYGDMYADYYSSDVLPCENDNDVDCSNLNYNNHTVIIEAANYNIRLGNAKVLTAKVYDANNNDVTDMYKDFECIWDFKLEDTTLNRKKLIVIDEDYSSKEGNEFKCKFKFDGDEQYLGHNITVTCKIEDLSSNISLDIIAL